MSRVITFSRTFPSYHPRKGEDTFFAEKIWKSLDKLELTSIHLDQCINNYYQQIGYLEKYNDIHSKYHTIRAGNRWKVGDKFSSRVWSGKPYASKQIIITPDIEIKKVWSITIELIRKPMENSDYETACYKFLIDGVIVNDVETLAKNDGLSYHDLIDWFKLFQSLDKPRLMRKVFDGQIICWSNNINY